MTFKTLKLYSFDTLAPAILGSQITNAIMLGEISYDIALKLEKGNLDLKYRQIYPALPVGTPDDPKKAAYFIFKIENGETIILCDYWINKSTIREISGVNINISFVNLNQESVEDIRQLLVASGYGNFTIT